MFLYLFLNCFGISRLRSSSEFFQVVAYLPRLFPIYLLEKKSSDRRTHAAQTCVVQGSAVRVKLEQSLADSS